MAEPTKSGGTPPNFYTAMAGMSPQAPPQGGAPGGAAGAGGAGAGAGNEKMDIASRFFKLAEKWAQTGKPEQAYAQRVMDVVKEYWMTELKKDPNELSGGAGGGTASPPPPPGASAPSGAIPPPAAATEGTQPVPA